jgi:serine/threonine-protein kinase
MLDEIILKVLSKEPSQRYRTADQLGRVLIALEETRQSASLSDTVASVIPDDVNGAGQYRDRIDQVIELPTPKAETSPARFHPAENEAQGYNRLAPVANAKPGTTFSTYSTNNTGQPIVAQGGQPASSNPLEIDWITIGLGLAALIAVGGLIPLWVWIYITFTQQLP